MILSEIDTGFPENQSAVSGTQSSRKSRSANRKSISLQYPSQIAEIRRRYESQGLMKDGASDVFKSAAELRGPRRRRG